MYHSPEAPVLFSPDGLQWGLLQTYSGLNTVNKQRRVTKKPKTFCLVALQIIAVYIFCVLEIGKKQEAGSLTESQMDI